MRWLVLPLLLSGGCSFQVDPLDPLGSGGDLRGADLRGRDLSLTDGPPVDLSRADLALADLAADLAFGAPDAEPPDMAPPVIVSHLPQHYLTDGTCDLAPTQTIDTKNLLVDGKTIPLGCSFTTEVENGVLTVAVLAVRNFAVAGTVQVIGDRPLAVVAENAITVDGKLDAAAKGAAPGAGADTFGAGGDGAPGAPHGGFDDAGGGGGSFGSDGKKGGNGNGQQGGAGGAVYPANDPLLAAMVQGGSPGGRQSAEDFGSCPVTNSGSGGGGGSIQLTAGGSISIGAAGAIDVGGGGGLGGCVNTGTPSAGSGGGGGSGGAIFLESPTVTAIAKSVLGANGGGGGGGADYFLNKAGSDGQDGPLATARAGGGNAGGAQGGGGGKGASSSGGATAGVDRGGVIGANGGGGGGGTGRIVIRSRGAAALSGVISPTANLDPSL